MRRDARRRAAGARPGGGRRGRGGSTRRGGGRRRRRGPRRRCPGRAACRRPARWRTPRRGRQAAAAQQRGQREVGVGVALVDGAQQVEGGVAGRVRGWRPAALRRGRGRRGPEPRAPPGGRRRRAAPRVIAGATFFGPSPFPLLIASPPTLARAAGPVGRGHRALARRPHLAQLDRRRSPSRPARAPRRPAPPGASGSRRRRAGRHDRAEPDPLPAPSRPRARRGRAGAHLAVDCMAGATSRPGRPRRSSLGASTRRRPAAARPPACRPRCRPGWRPAARRPPRRAGRAGRRWCPAGATASVMTP